jgi:hypothetical protein
MDEKIKLFISGMGDDYEKLIVPFFERGFSLFAQQCLTTYVLVAATREMSAHDLLQILNKEWEQNWKYQDPKVRGGPDAPGDQADRNSESLNNIREYFREPISGKNVMMTYRHPLSGKIVKGIKLGTGALLSESDLYDATSGVWDLCPAPGTKIQSDSIVTWVRPNLELSKEAVAMLSLLSDNVFVITKWDGCWGAIPEHQAMERIRGAQLYYPESIDELLDLGLIYQRDPNYPIYTLSASGEEITPSFLRFPPTIAE